MTQEEFDEQVFYEINNIKCKIEIKLYLEEKNKLINDLKLIKEQLDKLNKNNKDINVFEYQKYRNQLLEANTIIDKYDNKTLSEDEKMVLNKSKEEKKQIDTWFNNQKETKSNTNKELLQILNYQEIKQKDLLEINNIIKKFFEMNTNQGEIIDTNTLLEQITNLESKYNTDEFNEEEYNKLKEDFILQQQLIDAIISNTEEFYNQSIDKLEAKKKELEELKNDKTAYKIAFNNINNYEMDYNIWAEALNIAKSLKKEHNFIEKVIEKEPIEETPVEEEIPEITEETNNVENIYDLYGIEKPVEEVINGYKQINEPHKATFSQRLLNNLRMNTGFILNGDILLEGNIDLKFDNYPYIEIKEESFNNNKIDILNNLDARDKITVTNKNIKNIIEAIKNNILLKEDGIKQIDEYKNSIIENINNITNKYEKIKDILNMILSDNKKCYELSKLSLGKIEKEELELITEEELNIITMLNQKDFEELIILLINKKQYEIATEEINNINLDNENNKTK